VVVVSADALTTATGGVSLPSDVEVDWVDWVNDDRLLVGVRIPSTDRYQGVTYDTSLSRIMAVDRDGQNSITLFARARRRFEAYDLSQFVRLPDDPNAILMAVYDDDFRLNVHRVDVHTGRAKLVQAGTTDTYRWRSDLKGVARVRWDYFPRSRRFTVSIRAAGSDKWDRFSTYGDLDEPDLVFAAFTEDPNIAIVAARVTTDRYGLFEYNIVTRALGRPIFQNDAVDVGNRVDRVLIDPLTQKLIGVSYVEDVWQQHYFDADLAQLQQKLDAAFASAAIIQPVSWSKDRSRFILSTSGPKDPGSFHYYDAKANRATRLRKVNPNLPVSELGEMLIVRYRTRDNVQITGYLTMPPGKGDKKLPMAVMPHGGPETRDFVQYDKWAQMLANRGYVVFQPNFRGSGGYGRAFAEAGHRQWGRRMQDDVTDGVKALIADGTADPNRICIVGASYGGYSALAGGAFTADLYKCVVAIAGVTDIPAIVQWEEDQAGKDSARYEYWVKRLGDPKKDLEQMKSVSPALQAPNFKAPVLLIHGEHDDIVPLDQSVRMDKALRAAGKPVELVRIEREGHSFDKRESDIKVMLELERFLAAHLGN
jgi:dipeptidyl aminopeptidase/acylaminoacyl peptidase